MSNALRSSRLQDDETELFDASRNFNRALSLAREARGEPDHGLARTAWKTENWIKGNPGRMAMIGLMAAAGAASLLAFTKPNGKSKPGEK